MHNYAVNKPEILAPAGNMESLKSAVNNGANAVYLGLKNFSARSKAGNFSLEELEKAIKFAHFFNVKVYLAVNTIFKNEEKEDVLKNIFEAYKLGIDAIILQDLSILPLIRSTMPDIIVHFSTQAGVHNVYGAMVAKKLGADRIILSREATIEDIKRIKENVDIEVECFVHGALCVSFSGNCYFSSLVSGYSGNRGKCLQLCRKPYDFNGENKYWLSPKDLKMLNHLSDLKNAGVCSFKIEGRMRRPEYVGEAVCAYRKLLDNISYREENLSAMYNRGDYCTAHNFNPTENIIYPNIQGHMGKRVGKVVSLKNNKAMLSCTLKKGDAVKFITNNVESGTALISESGNSTTFVGKVYPNSEVRLTTDKQLIDEINARKIYVPINVKVEIKHNLNIIATVFNDRASYTQVSDFTLQNAEKSPLSNSDIKDIFAKCKDFDLVLDNIEIDNDNLSFAVKSQLNAFRRDLYENFYNIYVNSYENPKKQNCTFDFEKVYDCTNKIKLKDNAIFVQTDDLNKVEYLLKKCDYVAYSPRSYKEFYENIDLFPANAYLILPQIARGKDLEIIEKIAKSNKVNNVIVENIYALELFKDKNVILGSFCNILDDNFNANKIMSIESGVSNNGFIYSYGRYPIMTFTHCPKKTVQGSCKNCNKYDTMNIVDERNNEFTFRRFEVVYCYSHLLNSLPIDLSAVNSKQKINKIYLDLSGKSIDEMCYIIDCFKNRKSTQQKGTTGFYSKILE